MTVQSLIDRLEEIEDKDKPVVVFDDDTSDWETIVLIDEHPDCVELA